MTVHWEKLCDAAEYRIGFRTILDTKLTLLQTSISNMDTSFIFSNMDLTNGAMEISIQKIGTNANATGYSYSEKDYLPSKRFYHL